MSKKMHFPRKEAEQILDEIVRTAENELKTAGERIRDRVYTKKGSLRAEARREKVNSEKIARAIQQHEITVDDKVLKETESNFIQAAEKVIRDSDGAIPNTRLHELLIFISAGALTDFSVDSVSGLLQGDLILDAQKTGQDTDTHIQLKGSDSRIHIDYSKKGIEREIRKEFERQFKSGISTNNIGISTEQLKRFSAALADKGILWENVIDKQLRRGKVEDFLRQVAKTSAANYFLFGFSNASSEPMGGSYSPSMGKAGAYNLSVETKNLVEMYRSKPSQFSISKVGEGVNKKLELRFHGSETSMKQIFNSYADNPYIGLHHPVPKVFFRNRIKSKIETYNQNIQSNHFGFIHSNIFGDYRKGK